MEDCADQFIVLIHTLQDHQPPLTVQAKFLLLSRSLERRLTNICCVIRPPLALDPPVKHQTAVETAAFSNLNLPPDPDTASMDLHHPLVPKQIRLPHLKVSPAFLPPVWFLLATLLCASAHFRCTLRRS
jgi:hypothetical protein